MCGDTLVLQVTNSNLGGDPWPGADKVLTVIYRMGGREQTATVREGNVHRIPQRQHDRQGRLAVSSRPFSLLRFLPGEGATMRLLIALCALLSCSLCSAQKVDTLDDCRKKANSQADLTTCADRELQRADAAMRGDYERLLSKAKDDPVAETKIKAAQQAWLAFRDAQLEAMYPHEDKLAEYGSAYPMCLLLLKTELTKDRARMLAKMLHPVEGEVCVAGLRYPVRAADAWLGKWIGPEGTFLVLSQHAGKYAVEIHSLDGPATYEGTAVGDRIEFVRDSKRESIHAGNGEDSGMKWLLDKKNCLIIKTGEGFCRE